MVSVVHSCVFTDRFRHQLGSNTTPQVIYDPQDPHASLYDVDDASTIITLADWYHRFAPDLQAEYLSPNNTFSREQLPDCGTINGSGRYGTTASGLGPLTDRAVVNVEAGKRYRFRIINASAIGLFRFSIEGHTFTVIEADGVNLVPYPADYLEISAGQRYSVVVSAHGVT
jgi:iron transport multicopper oxidase